MGADRAPLRFGGPASERRIVFEGAPAGLAAARPTPTGEHLAAYDVGA